MPESGASGRRWRLAGLLGAGVLLLAAAFGGTITGSFLADDFNIVEAVRQGGPFGKWAGEGEVFFRPLVAALFNLDLHLHGLDARGYHLTNLLLHLVAACGVGVLAAQTAARLVARDPEGEPGREPEARKSGHHELGVTAGLLFLVHPSHLEPVSWIAGRGDLLVTVFALGCLVAHGRWRTGHGVSWRLVSALAFLGALASKEAAVTLPAAVVVLDLFVFARPWTARPWTRRLREALAGAWPLLALVPVYLGLRWAVLGEAVGGYGTRAHLKTDPAFLLDQLFTFLSRAVVPRIGGEQLPNGAVAVLAGVAAWWLVRRARGRAEAGVPGRLIGLSATLFGVLALPALSLPLSRISTAAERLVYLPSVFAALLAAGVLTLAFRSARWRRAAVALVVLAFTVQTALGTRAWREAARACTAVTEGILSSEPRGTLYLLALPDNVRGAFVLRNGLANALAQNALAQAGDRPRRIVVVSQVELSELGSRLEIERRGKVFTLTVAERSPLFRFRPRRGTVPEVRELGAGRFRLRVKLPRLRPRDRVMVFSGGRLEVVKAGTEGSG